MKRLLALLFLVSLSAHAGLESGTYTNDLIITNPVSASDPISAGADHIRLIKSVIKNTFPGMAGTFSRVQTKSGNYAGVLNDNTSLINFTAIATFTLPDAATVGNGWHVFVWANGANITLTPSNGAQTVNGAATGTVTNATFAVLFSDGSNFQSLATPSTEPAGMIRVFGGTSTPTGYLLCDGSAVSRATYASLFGAIGTTWGSGDGSTTFNVPDLRRRVLAGSGGSSTSTLGNAVGNTGGEETHTMTSGELVAHSHGVTDPGHTHSETGQNTVGPGTGATASTSNNAGVIATTNSATTGISINNTGSTTPFNVRDPSAVVLYIIKF